MTQAISSIRTVFALAGIALHHLVASLEAGERHVRDGVLFVVSLLRGDDRRECRQREVDSGETAAHY